MPDSFEYYTQTTMSEEVIVQRVAHANRMLADELPDDPPRLPEDSVQRMRNLPSTSRIHVWVLRHQDRIAAQAYLGWAELDSNRQSAGVHVTVEPPLRRRGIGTRLLALAAARSHQAGRPLLFAHSSDRVPAGGRFLKGMGFKPGLATHLNQLIVERLDQELLARWLTAGSKGAADYTVELWDGPVPEDRLAAFAELSNVMNSEPHGELEVEDTIVTPKMIRDGEAFLFADGSRRLIACARHLPSGALVGFTELSWSPKRAAIVWQHGTGVLEAHRNKGLGRWLKAANMQALLGTNPAARVVRAGNADSNAPMLAINRQLGFAPFIAEIAWQGRVPTIARRLKRRRETADDKPRKPVSGTASNRFAL